VRLNLSPELFGEDDNVFIAARIMVRCRLAEVPELKVLDEPKAGARDHNGVGGLQGRRI